MKKIIKSLSPILSVLLVMSLVLSGCTGGQSEAPVSQGGDSPQGQASGKDTLVIAVAGDIENLDPTFASFPRSTEAIANIYDQLTTYSIVENADGLKVSDTSDPVGALVESIDLSDDGRTYTFKLKENIKFASGNPLTTADVKYSFDRAANAGEGSGTFDLSVATISQPVDVVDEYTFKIYTDKTNPSTLNVLAMGGLSIFDSVLMQANATSDDPWATEWCKKNTAGSGPWVIDQWDSGVEIVFRANENYWGEKPAYAKMIWKIIPAASNRVMLLENGEIDVAEDISDKDANALAEKDGVRLMSFPSQNQFFLAMNFSSPPFDNKLVRQAMAYATPYDEIINNVYYGNGRKAVGPVPVGTPGQYDGVRTYDTDAEKAKSLLKEAGMEAGISVSMYIDSAKAEHEKAAVFIQDSLSKVGIDVTVEKLNPAAFQEKKYTNTLPMYLDESLAWVDEPGYVFNLLWYTGAYSNNNNYSNAALDALVDEARFTLDETKRTEMFNEAQEILMEDCPAAFLCQPNYNMVMRDNISEFVMFFDELLRYKYMK